MEFLKGKRTYIIAALGAVAFFLEKAGFITPEAYTSLVSLLAPLGLASLRAAKS